MECDLVRLKMSILEISNGSYERKLPESFTRCPECCPLFLKRMEDAGYNKPFEDEIIVKDVMNEVAKFIRANLAIDKKELLKLDNLAGYFVMSIPTLKMSFKKKHGIAIHEFIIECRMEWAILLISKTGRSVKEIAYQMGYEEPCNFSRDFKKYTKMSPNGYRQIIRN